MIAKFTDDLWDRGPLSTAYKTCKQLTKTLGSKRPAVDWLIVVYCSSVDFATINATMSLYSYTNEMILLRDYVVIIACNSAFKSHLCLSYLCPPFGFHLPFQWPSFMAHHCYHILHLFVQKYTVCSHLQFRIGTFMPKTESPNIRKNCWSLATNAWNVHISMLTHAFIQCYTQCNHTYLIWMPNLL